MVQGSNGQEGIRFLRERQVAELTGLSKTTRWRLENEGNFPKRRRLSENTIAWRSDEINEWLNSRQLASAERVQ
jgi:prophage regulatory protein